ncbi:MAG: tripartite tricarboxylate transporter substrate binding protein [Casimicrobiaceae bacterium]|nr:tripartite tricarboxylate transporter substrate binding protein [Casimicrobiaceae bacterium]MCX8099332.1 tripartite tricarboxylate transporter substrate binding protein [Casimicrobiaceae bacterium]MDW8313073.1 tripartite tricarboxylate transporter substrate binding protein [Burkholderiales bacterium]
MLRVLVALVFALTVGVAQAQYPERPIKLIVPFAAGAGTDAVARFLAQKLEAELKLPIVVENRAGASGAIGTQYVASAAPDGYTLLFVASPFTTVAAATPEVAKYDPVRGFTPVALIAAGPLVWAASEKAPFNTLREMIAYAKANPGKLSYGSAGTGGVNHLALELFKARTGTDILHVPYKGIAPATTDLLGGQIQLLTGSIPAMLPHFKAGKAKPLAVTGTRRVPQLPDVPTVAEAGAPGTEVFNYWGIVAPAGTPQPIVARLNAEVQKILAQRDVQERLTADGVELTPGGPERLASFIANDYNGWRKLIAEAKLRFD